MLCPWKEQVPIAEKLKIPGGTDQLESTEANFPMESFISFDSFDSKFWLEEEMTKALQESI